MYVTFEKMKQRYQRLRSITDMGRRLKLIYPFLKDEEKAEVEKHFKTCHEDDSDFNWIKMWLKSKSKERGE